MQLALLAFALGVLALQQQPEWPRLAWGVIIAAPLALSLIAFFIARHASSSIVRSARIVTSLRAELLGVPHHGSRTASTASFIAAVSPQIALFTPGYRNRFGHPRPEVVERYAKAGTESHGTDYEGALSFDFKPGARLAALAQRDLDRRYWYDTPMRSDLPPLE